MKSERLSWIILVFVLLAVGWLVGRTFWSPPTQATTESESFRAWFWDARGLDLAVQIGLIMAGALGVAALLPMKEDDL